MIPFGRLALCLNCDITFDIQRKYCPSCAGDSLVLLARCLGRPPKQMSLGKAASLCYAKARTYLEDVIACFEGAQDSVLRAAAIALRDAALEEEKATEAAAYARLMALEKGVG